MLSTDVARGIFYFQDVLLSTSFGSTGRLHYFAITGQWSAHSAIHERNIEPMRYYVTLLALLFSCGTAPQKQESSSTSQNAPEPESLAELLSETEQRQDSIHNPSHEIADEKPKREVQPDSTRCSIKMLVYVDQNFGDLTRQDINSFLKIFHQECKSNVEFSEWSNELLFKVLDSYTETTLNLIATKKGYDLSAILDELEYPIHDGIRPQPLIEKIEGMVNNDSTTNKVIKSLTVAASKY